MIGKFFEEHWKIILIGLTGVVLGVLLNYTVGKYQNNKLLSSLITEHKKLQEKATAGTLTVEEQKQKEILETEIYMLQFKCK